MPSRLAGPASGAVKAEAASFTAAPPPLTTYNAESALAVAAAAVESAKVGSYHCVYVVACALRQMLAAAGSWADHLLHAGCYIQVSTASICCLHMQFLIRPTKYRLQDDYTAAIAYASMCCSCAWRA